MGAVSPFESARKTSRAPPSATGTTISSLTASYARPCIVRDRWVACPSMMRLGATFPFANLENAEILGTLTQFGTRISSRFESYAAAEALVNPHVEIGRAHV